MSAPTTARELHRAITATADEYAIALCRITSAANLGLEEAEMERRNREFSARGDQLQQLLDQLVSLVVEAPAAGRADR